MTVSGVPKPSQWYTYAAIDKKTIFFSIFPTPLHKMDL